MLRRLRAKMSNFSLRQDVQTPKFGEDPVIPIAEALTDFVVLYEILPWLDAQSLCSFGESSRGGRATSLLPFLWRGLCVSLIGVDTIDLDQNQLDLTFLFIYRFLHQLESHPTGFTTDYNYGGDVAFSDRNADGVPQSAVLDPEIELGGDRALRSDVCLPDHLPRVTLRSNGSIGEEHTHILGLSLISYFEITIDEAPYASSNLGWRDPCVAIGLCPKSFPLTGRQPGWNRGGFGYHGDDGHIFSGSGFGHSFGPVFGAGDTVGCGIRYSFSEPPGLTAIVFFTKGAEFVGDAFKFRIPSGEPMPKLYPIVGMDSLCPVTINFGMDRSFEFREGLREMCKQCWKDEGVFFDGEISPALLSIENIIQCMGEMKCAPVGHSSNSHHFRFGRAIAQLTGRLGLEVRAASASDGSYSDSEDSWIIDDDDEWSDDEHSDTLNDVNPYGYGEARTVD